MKKQFLTILFFVPFLHTTILAQNILLWNGEVPDINLCSFSYGNPNGTQAQEGDWCFEGMPDPWHRPTINLSCQDNWRVNIEHYDELQFYAKADQAGKTFDVSASGWPLSSHAVNIDPYIDGGALTTDYHLVKIPIDSLKTTNYLLNSVEFLYFGTSQSGDTHHIFIDDIWAIDSTPLSVSDYQIISDKVIKLTIDGRYDTTDVHTLSHYSLQSLTDPAFANPTHPASIGIHYYVEDFAENTSTAVPIQVFELFLLFDTPMSQTKEYELSVLDVKDLACNSFPSPQQFDFTYDDSQYINGSVKINQVGYLPKSRKYAYIGNYLGSAEMMTIAPTTFEVRDANTDGIVLTGTPTFRGEDLRLSGEMVYEADFTALETAGDYYVYVPTIGRSFSFKIGDDVYNEVYYTTVRGLYYQRCGMALEPEFAGQWSHGACHLEDALIHESCANTSLYNGETIGDTIPMIGGWHDAGDYGKYVASIATLMSNIFNAYELFPQKFPDDFNHIPESGNGVPDLLDEAKHQIDWLLEMQAPDGGVYFKCTTTAWPNDMPEFDSATRFLAEKTTQTTGHYAAILAMAYRTFQPFFPVYADTCLARAERAWTFLENHPNTVPPGGFVNPPGIGGGEYSDPLGDTDERAWAAAELYKSTCHPDYHTAFENYWLQHETIWGWNTHQHFQRLASWAYATTEQCAVNATYVNEFKTDFQNELENLILPRSDNNVYRCGYRSDVIEWIGWGSYAHSSRYALELIKGFLSTG